MIMSSFVEHTDRQLTCRKVPSHTLHSETTVVWILVRPSPPQTLTSANTIAVKVGHVEEEVDKQINSFDRVPFREILAVAPMS